MRVLVTGGAGYIGSHTAKQLEKSGHEPVILDSLVRGHRWAAREYPFYEMDIGDERMARILRDEKIEAVMHFAAFAYVGESMHQPFMYYENNVGATIRLLASMRQARVKKMIFSSTCATYGLPEKLPITESTPQNPINPYGFTKLTVERLLRDMGVSEGLKSVSLRYFNAAGADPDLQLGEDHQPETHLIPLAIEAAFQENKSLSVFGTDYPTADGTCVRDYIHVTDLADAHVKALQWLENAPQVTNVFNLGTGRGASVMEVIRAVEKVTGRPVKYKLETRRPGDPPELVADGGLAMKVLGWTPQFKDLASIVTTAVQWYEHHHLRGQK